MNSIPHTFFSPANDLYTFPLMRTLKKYLYAFALSIISYLGLLWVIPKRIRKDQCIEKCHPLKQIDPFQLSPFFMQSIASLDIKMIGIEKEIDKVNEIFKKEKGRVISLNYAYEHFSLHNNLVKITDRINKTTQDKAKNIWKKLLKKIDKKFYLLFPNYHQIILNLEREINDIRNGCRVHPSITGIVGPLSSLSQSDQQQMKKILTDNFSNPFNPKIEKKEYFNKNSVFIAKFKEKIIGLLIYSKKDHYIEAIACSPQWARYGIGTKLFQALVNHFNDKTLKSPEWITLEVRPKSPAKNKYLQLGFKEFQGQGLPYLNPQENTVPMKISFQTLRRALALRKAI